MFPSPAKLVVSPSISLRTHDCKYQESLAMRKKSKILIIFQKNPFGELSSKKNIFNFQESTAFEKMRKDEDSGFYLINYAKKSESKNDLLLSMVCFKP